MTLAVGLDIGGTLAKVCVKVPAGQPVRLNGRLETALQLLAPTLDGDFDLHFSWWHTENIAELVESLQSAGVTCVSVTGGGAYKYDQALRSAFTVHKVDEMEAASSGLAAIFQHSMVTQEPLFARVDPSTGQVCWEASSAPVYPFLLVTVGSGVSIIKVWSANHYQRVSGTCIGGGTALGLARCLLGVESFDELTSLAETGTGVLDLTVGDAASAIFPPDTLACSFGRIFDNPDFDSPSVAWSLLHMVANNLGYLAHLVAQLHGCRKLYFGGKFVKQHPITMASITKGVAFAQQYYSSEGEAVSAYFIKHDGYLGVIGCLTRTTNLACLDSSSPRPLDPASKLQ